MFDKPLWNQLNGQSIHMIIEYLNLFEKKNINKYYYTNVNAIINNSKFKILKWYKIRTLDLNESTVLEYNTFYSEQRIRAVYILRYPDEYKLDMIKLAKYKISKDITKYYNTNLSVKQAWRMFVNDCNKSELLYLGW